MNEPQSLKAVLGSIFLRRGRETSRTKLFENFPTSMQSSLLTSSITDPQELPILASVLNSEHWVLITTNKIVDYRHGNPTSIACMLLEDATVALGVDAMRGATTKSELSSLKLKLYGKHDYLLEVESGPHYIGIWNVLKHFAVR